MDERKGGRGLCRPLRPGHRRGGADAAGDREGAGDFADREEGVDEVVS